MVVLLLPARSAEPPHSSGRFGPILASTSPDAARVASALEPGSHCGRAASQPSGSSLGQQAIQQPLAFWLACRPRLELRLPGVAGLLTALQQATGVGDDVLADDEALVRVEAEHPFGSGNLVGAQRRTVHAAGVHLGGRGIADDGAHTDE